MDDITLNPNCSEAVYRLNTKAIWNLTQKEAEILIEITGGVFETRDSESEYRNYFEKTELDLFLDYFQIPSRRNHWTCYATSEMTKKNYTEAMKLFCSKHGLPFKDIYDNRHMGEDDDLYGE